MEVGMEVFQENESRFAMWLTCTIPMYVTKEHTQSQRAQRHLHTVYDNTVHIAKLWNQASCPSIEEWVKKMWGTFFFSCKEEWNNGIYKKMHAANV